MPIRQERMIALINAAIDYRSLALMFEKWIKDPNINSLPHSELISTIANWNLQLAYAMNERAAKHNAVIANEFANFYKNRERNEREKINARTRRHIEGVTKTRRQPKMYFEETDKLIVRDDIVYMDTPAEVMPYQRAAAEMTPDELTAYNKLKEENERKMREEQGEAAGYEQGQRVQLSFANDETEEGEE